jgi:hypothetical protein
VQRGLVPAILSRFLSKVRHSWRAAKLGKAGCLCLLKASESNSMQGYTLVGMKLMNVSKQLAETHYADLSSKPFFAGACYRRGLPVFQSTCLITPLTAP